MVVHPAGLPEGIREQVFLLRRWIQSESIRSVNDQRRRLYALPNTACSPTPTPEFLVVINHKIRKPEHFSNRRSDAARMEDLTASPGVLFPCCGRASTGKRHSGLD